MTNVKNESFRLLSVASAACLGLIVMVGIDQSRAAPANDGGAAAAASGARAQVQAQVQPDIEKRRQEAQQQAQKNLDQEAIAAITETENAIAAIASGNKAEALAAIERATGKINVLVARNPATALLPVSAEVDIIELVDDVMALFHAKARDKGLLVSIAEHQHHRHLLLLGVA